MEYAKNVTNARSGRFMSSSRIHSRQVHSKRTWLPIESRVYKESGHACQRQWSAAVLRRRGREAGPGRSCDAGKATGHGGDPEFHRVSNQATKTKPAPEGAGDKIVRKSQRLRSWRSTP